MRWNPPTLAGKLPPDTACRCLCGRTTAPDMMWDLSAIPAAILAKIGLPAQACEGCVSLALRQQRISRVALVTALGAGAAVIARAQVQAQSRKESQATSLPTVQ